MRISGFLQTPFISYDDKNMVYIRVEDWDMCNPYQVDIFVNGENVYTKRIFAPELSAMIPCFECECVATVRLTPFEDLPVEREFKIKPDSKWQIPLLYSSHEDLGYCAYIEKLHFECYEYLKKAMELCVLHDDFKYMIEHYWWLNAFDFYATEEEKQLLKKLFAQKRIELNSIHSGVHTSWEGSEQLVRQMYFGCIEAKKKYEISPECAFFADLSGATPSVISAYSQMGIKYVGFFANSFRNCSENNNIPPIFWWEDKNNKNRVLLWNQRSYRMNGLNGIWCDTKRQYDEGEFFFDNTKMLKTEKIISEKISTLEKYGYNIFPISFYDDREMPTTMLLTVCREMNKKWKYPKFRMEIPSVFMKELSERFGDKIPTLSGDIADQWADFATIAPNMMAEKRSVSRMLYDAEMLSCIESIKNNRIYDSKSFRDIYFKLCEFDEHCWATSSKHPQNMHKHNIEVVKKSSVEESSRALKNILDELVPRAENEQISIINTIPRRRKNHIRADKNSIIPKNVKHQILPDNSVVTEAIELDSTEIKSFEGVYATRECAEIKANCIETDFHIVKINNITKKITSLIDKETGEEYIDNQARLELGQFIYAYTEQKTDPRLSFEIPSKIDLRIYEGDVAYAVVITGYEEQSGAETLAQLTFYKHEKTIDVDLSYKNAKGLMGDYYDRYKKNYFFAFPFKLENPKFYTELAVGEKDEANDNIPLNASDFTVAQNWVCAENDRQGVAIYTRDMPVFHLGHIKYNQFSRDFCEDKAHFYLYASSNRCNNLIYSSTEDCYAKYHLSVLTYSGNHNKIVPLWSNENEHNLLIGKADLCKNSAFISLSQDNVRLVALKKAEDKDALIFRFIETEGKEALCDMELSFKPSKASYVTNDEKELEKISIKDKTVSFKCQPYSYVAISIEK